MAHLLGGAARTGPADAVVFQTVVARVAPGRAIALLPVMSMRKGLDRQPGPLPEIKADSGSVLFSMDVGARDGDRLVIRCDVNGNVWAAIRHPK
jgi:hypothetical protein